jgi:hypothetical protein
MSDHKSFAQTFAERLAARDYAAAHPMLTTELQDRLSLAQLRMQFERMCRPGWKFDGIEVLQTMDDWPDRRSGDLGWVYVSIGGEVYSEAVTVVVAQEQREPRIRELEFGRP